MTLYQGYRKDHRCHLVADNTELPAPQLNGFNDEDSFEWGYAGRGPDRLALSILAHHFGSIGLALNHRKNFVDNVIAELPFEGWTLTSEEIDQALNGSHNGVVEVNLTLTELMSKVRGNPEPYRA